MDKNEFKEFCKKKFYQFGFKKVKNMYYLLGEDLLCGISLQKSNYGPAYYINFDYFIGDYSNVKTYPTYYDSDVYDRIVVMSKAKHNGEFFMTALIEYEEYTAEELEPYLEEGIKNIVLPPVYEGKKYILDNLGKKYSLTLHPEEVLQKLKS